MVVSVVLAMEGMVLEVGVALEGKGLMEEGAVELGDTAAAMELENAALKEGGLLSDGVTGLSMGVAQVLLEMLPTSNICTQKSASGMGRRHSPSRQRQGWLSCPPLSHR